MFGLPPPPEPPRIIVPPGFSVRDDPPGRVTYVPGPGRKRDLVLVAFLAGLLAGAVATAAIFAAAGYSAVTSIATEQND